MFKVANPVPRVIHPDWLHKKVREKDDKYRQKKLVDIFGSLSKNNCLKGSSDVISNKHGVDEQNAADLEDFGKISRTFRVGPRPVVHCFDANKVQQLSKTSSELECPPQQSIHDGGTPKRWTSPQEAAISKESIDRKVDYRGWLELKKRKWRERREKRKRQR